MVGTAYRPKVSNIVKRKGFFKSLWDRICESREKRKQVKQARRANFVAQEKSRSDEFVGGAAVTLEVAKAIDRKNKLRLLKGKKK